ncbi:MAG TPA: iron-sulfur cluster repair di-iron protein [Chitinophagaceae bacterium]|nr:iron-sulfur cluster repair di-iron protein [Chitinophagaceae bacterium]
MNRPLASLSLAQIVNSNHKAASVFEKYHLDFCCKGKRSLEQACTEQQLTVSQITGELENIFGNETNTDAVDFDKMNLTQLSDYIVQTHHAYVKNEMPQIYAYLQKVASKHGERHDELYKIFETFAAIREEMDGHMKKEEVILFPRIKELEKLADNENANLQLNITYLQSPITVMEQEHDHAGTLLDDIRILSNDYTPPQDACTTYRLCFAALKAFELDLHQHVHLENNILFPKAIQLFKQLQTEVLN